MGSADFKLIRPVTIAGDVPFTRASPKWVFDRTGALVQVPVDTLGVTYDPLDLSRAPYALIEQEATNYTRRTTQFEHTVWDKQVATGGGGVANAAIAPDGTMTAFEFTAAPSTSNFAWLCQGFAGDSPDASLDWVYSFWVRVAEGTAQVAPAISNLSIATRTSGYQTVTTEWKRMFYAMPRDQLANTGRLGCGLFLNGPNRKILIWGPQLERGPAPTSYIPNPTDAPVFRAADVVGVGAGLVYSTVPIAEPNYDATVTYAKDAIVLDPATRMTYQSLIDVNKGQALTVATAWLPLGATNRWKMFDKAVNSQTAAADVLTVVIRPGELVNTLAMLNVAGASVGVAQSDSGYNRRRPLVTHDVLSWYDFWYQEPLWLGDTVFDDIPPYPGSLLTITVSSPGNQAALGGLFAGRAKFLGTTQWELTAGILSYSTSETDKFGNTTLVKRNNAKKMNFEVSIPRGYEDEVYRFMRAADNVEMVAIATTGWALAMSYGYLGAWEVPLSISGKTMPVEWRGLI